mgnify:CR=1 FL=1
MSTIAEVTVMGLPALYVPLSTGDAHQIHHLREKGYVEKPARVSAILRGLVIGSRSYSG